VIAGLTLGTTFSMCSILFDVTTFVPSSVTVCWSTTGFLSDYLGRGEVETSWTCPVLVSETTVTVTYL
jgi:hypothetical protein